MTPKRIQRRRTKGWKMPPGALYVGRPTPYGNPYKTAQEYREWLNGDLPGQFRYDRQFVISHVKYLRGIDLACWCPLDKPCHADILLELANQ